MGSNVHRKHPQNASLENDKRENCLDLNENFSLTTSESTLEFQVARYDEEDFPACSFELLRNDAEAALTCQIKIRIKTSQSLRRLDMTRCSARTAITADDKNIVLKPENVNVPMKNYNSLPSMKQALLYMRRHQFQS